MRFPVDDRYEFDYDESQGYPGHIPTETMALFVEDEMNRASKVAPDTTGTDKFFIDGFITEEMEFDFWKIAKHIR